MEGQLSKSIGDMKNLLVASFDGVQQNIAKMEQRRLSFQSNNERQFQHMDKHMKHVDNKRTRAGSQDNSDKRPRTEA